MRPKSTAVMINEYYECKFMMDGFYQQQSIRVCHKR